MKQPFPIILLFILFALNSCGKQEQPRTTCRLQQSNYRASNNTVVSLTKYEYDISGRIIKTTDIGNNTITYNYYNDSVVSTTAFERHVYFLNNKGLADSSRSTFTGSPGQFRFSYKYTYDSDGHLINKREIFSQLFNGNMIHDTTFNTFTYSNGNLVRSSNTKVLNDIIFEYSLATLPTNNPELSGELHKLPFLGKQSRNLIIKVHENGVVLSTVSYERDNQAKITRQLFTSSNPQQNTAVEFFYLCN